MRYVLFSVICAVAFRGSTLSAQGRLERVLNATVTVKTLAGGKSGSGSGFIVGGDGVVVTAAHVLEGATAAAIITRSAEEFAVQGLLWLDAERDFAILRIAAFDLPVIELGNSETLAVGQRLLAVGAPLGLQASVSDGLVSQVRILDGTRLIQISVPVSPGSSGGPIVTEDGKVVGIVISGLRGGGAENLNFALPINYIRGALALTSDAAMVPLGASGRVRASAQSIPNLSGTWALVPDKSDFGPMPPPQSRTDVIDHKEPALVINRTQMTPNGEVSARLVYAVDGKPYKNLVADAEVTSTLRWEGSVLVIVSTVGTPNGEATLTDRYALSEDGKTLTQSRTISIQGQKLVQTMVLEKKP